MAVRRSFSLVALTILFSLSATLLTRFADADAQPDETLPGFHANDVLFSGTYDNVSAFSGDDNVAIPLGPAYKLGKDFQYQLKAFNSLKLWYLLDGGSCEMQIGGTKDTTQAFVSGLPTIGAGWTLTPGYVTDDTDLSTNYTYVYVSPDGGHHPTGPDGITLDNSRLKVACTGSPSWTSCTVDFPDGTVQTFAHPIPDPAPTAGTSPDFSLGSISQAMGLTTVKDAWGRTVMTVDYNASPAWEVSHVYLGSGTGSPITFAWGSTTVGSVTWPTLSSLTFPKIGSSAQQSIAFVYFSNGITRTPADTTLPTSDSCPCDTSEQDTATAYVPLVNTVTIKNGATPIGQFTMGYTSDAGKSGSLNSLTLPTGGQISYTLDIAQHVAAGSGTWPDTTIEGTDPAGFPPAPPPGVTCPPTHHFVADALGSSVAVATRTVTDANGGSSTTTYSRIDRMYPGYPNPGTGGYNTRIVEVVEPKDTASSAKMTRYLFHIADPGSADPTLSGVEIEHSLFDGSTFTGTPVRTDIQCTDFGTATGFCGYLTADGTSVNQFTSSDAGAHPSGHVLWYGAKPSTATDHSGGSCPSGTTTECVAQTSTPASGWVTNGYHYEFTTTTSANMPANVNRGTDTIWAPSGWLLDLVSKRSVYDGIEPADPNQSDGSTVAREWHENNTATGFLNGSLTWDSPSHTLLLNCRYPDSAGAAAHSLSFSDAEFSSPPSNVCATSFPSWPPTVNVTSLGANGDYFGHNYSSQNAQLTLAQWVTGSTGSVQAMPWNAFSATRDTNTGLITASTDSSSHTTSYVYDGLGRLTSLTPSGEEATAISYDSPTQTTVTRTGTGGNTWERYQYDGLGRLIREKRQLGGTNAFSVRGHVYDAAGHEYYTSEWKPCTSDADCQSKTFTPAACPSGGSGAFGTTRCSYDPLGRPTKTIKADGSYVTVDRTDGSTLYSDTAETATTYNSGGTVAAGPYITKRDALGRVTSVVEPSVGSGADTTTYTYNVLDKLSGVTQGVQTRSFGYNAFGFLKSETNPENGTTSYTYGSQGDVLTKSVGGKSYSFTYDPAIRQLAAKSGATTYHSFTYDASCSTFTTAPCGKLTSSIGYNPLLATAPTVTQAITYTGVGGRMSARTTTINPTIAGSETFNEAWTYNTLGLVSVYTHPYPTGLSTVDSTYTYSNGYPAGMSSLGNTLVSNVAYLPDGRVGSSILGGTRTVTVSQDTSSYLPRPTDIKMQISGSTVWDSGTYTYDGAGNIKTIGSNTYGYDVRNRLTSSTVNAIPSTFTFDRYGNLTSAGATTASNNHLTSGVYDALGNLTSFSGKSYTYDDFSRQKGYTTTGETYVYDASDERVARVPSSNTPWSVTLRDDGNKLASEYSLTSSGYTRTKDYYTFGNQLVTTLDWVAVNALYWVDDHLGTPRYGDETIGGHETHDYQPFGQEIGGSFGAQPLKFASMERDQSSGNDYDHARYDLTGVGRFLGVDQLGGRQGDPQSWNRYGYARGNPVRFDDPTGLEFSCTDDSGTNCTETSTFLPPEKPDQPPTVSSGTSEFFSGNFGRQAAAAFTNNSLPAMYRNRAASALSKGDYLAYALDQLGMHLFPENYLSVQGLAFGLAMVGVPEAEAGEGGLLVPEWTGFTKHGINQAISRDGVGVTPGAIGDAIRSPIAPVTRGVDQLGRPYFEFIGKQAVVWLNEAGKVISTYATTSAAWRLMP